MGIVYLARDPQIERELALKTIRFDTGEKSFGVDEAKARFLKEARISGRLQHPHIVTVFDVGEDQGTLFLAMELVQGGSFSQRLSDPAGFPLRDRIRVVAEVAEALAHAHERGVLHRDVKPANILLSPTLSAKVTDFGIGKLLTGDTELTSTGQMVGSPAYMSPEQIKGEKLDARTDIFSLGIVLYQALTLRKPFPADTLTTLVYQILHEEPMDPGLVTSDVPEGMKDIIRKCLAKDRANRYSDAGELADDLREILGFSPLGSTAGLTESKVKRVRSSPGAPPPVAPLAEPATPASMAPTAAVRVSPPVGKLPETRAPPRSRPASECRLPPRPVADSESPTITTGRRMGEVMAKAAGAAAPPRKKRASRLSFWGAAFSRPSSSCSACSRSRKRGKKSVGRQLRARSDRGARRLRPGTAFRPSRSPAAKAPGATGASTAGPAVAVVETPARDAPPTVVPTKRARVKPTAAPQEAAAAAPRLPPFHGAEGAPQKPADLTVTVRRFLKLDVSPSQARVYLDGRYIGISDDWDDAGGGSLLAFNIEGTHRLRLCCAGPSRPDRGPHRAIDGDRRQGHDRPQLEKGPDGPTGPAWSRGKAQAPELQDGARRRVQRRAARRDGLGERPRAGAGVEVREGGPSVRGHGGLRGPLDRARATSRRRCEFSSGPAAGEVRANIKEKLKKM